MKAIKALNLKTFSCLLSCDFNLAFFVIGLFEKKQLQKQPETLISISGGQQEVS